MNKKHVVLMALVAVLVIVGSFATARASGSFTVHGRWAGSAFANPEFDLNGDGVSGRQFDVKAFEQLPFSGIEGALDSALVGFGCGGPGSLELKPLGKITFRGRLGDSLYAEVDPAGPNLCFDPAVPSEVLHVVLVGGTGNYASATGTGILTIRDVVRMTRNVTVPGVGVVPAPTFIDTRGEFDLTIH
jgi:hypothetical protein